MMKEDFVLKMHETIDIAKRKDVNACDVVAGHGSLFSVKVNSGAIDEYKVSSSQSIGIRVIKDGRVGISYSESLDKESLETMVKSSIENSTFMEEDEDSIIPNQSGEKLINESDKNFYQESIELEKKIDVAFKMADEPKKMSEYIQNVPYSQFQESEYHSYFLNSHGTLGYSPSKSYSCYSYALADKNDSKAMYGEASVARKFQDLEVERVLKNTVDHSVELTAGRTIPTGSYDVIWDTNAFQSLLSCFMLCLSGKAAAEGKNPWKDKLNEQVADKRFSLLDDPHLGQGITHHLFDSEGLLHEKTDLVKNGNLANFLNNSYTAKKLGVRNTHHAARSAKGHLSTAATNLMIEAGITDQDALLKNKYLLIKSMDGLHSGHNSISGDFSFGASGLVCEGGKVLHPFKGVTISGNFYKLLNQISDIGNEYKMNSSYSFMSPDIRFSEVKIAGS